MKNILLLIAFIAFGINVNAQSATLKTSPGALAFGFFNACYEKVISDKASFQVSGLAFFNIGNNDESAYGVGAGYRMYVTKQEAPRGFYVMPQVGGIFGEDVSAIGLGADLGYQWIWDSGFVLDIGLGPNYYIGLGDNVDEDFDGIIPRVILAVGYAW
jgi:hypothetical protein